jgi:phosphoribosylaminoimidazole-succinocarboxamide synthase
LHYDRNGALIATEISELGTPKRGKVRDIYDLGDSLLLVASDRISAFDVVMGNGIPTKGKVLTMMSKFWFEQLDFMPNHLITMDPAEYPDPLPAYAEHLAGRSMLVKKVDALPVECVARGYLVGSGWKDYQKTGCVCGIMLRQGYNLAGKLDSPIYTPAFKADQGAHDENITYAETITLIGADTAAYVRQQSLRLYDTAAQIADERGIIIADTKFEFGRDGYEVILIDEVLTPDSSRFWPAQSYAEGTNPPSLDKQFVRDYLDTLDWGKTAPGPELPDEIVESTIAKYAGAYRQLTGRDL